MIEKPVVEVSGLGKTVDNGGEPLTILQDISFSVMSGETVAIVGASGSGKSTLLGLLAGLDVPTAGEIRLDGI
jgi:putative ABC transport system ATP-binding protein